MNMETDGAHIDRRIAVKMSLLAPLITGQVIRAQAQTPVQTSHSKPREGGYVDKMPPAWRGNEKIAIVIYDHMTPLDIVGPHYFLGRLPGAEIHIVAKSLNPVPCEYGLTLVPTVTFNTCPKDLDVLLTGGGTNGTLAAMRDPDMIAFLADRGSRAKWVASVCTGSLLLGRAGLLRGYRATSHWVGRPLLKHFGAIEVDQRVVFDRNRATGAGVSAGLDLALALVEKLRPLEFRQAVQLLAEYAPEPPLDSGTPDRAPATIFAQMRDLTAGFVDGVNEIVCASQIKS
jgi:cyclohexyl-isocyanide hydratase